jgi:hypothetical protein
MDVLIFVVLLGVDPPPLPLPQADNVKQSADRTNNKQ